MHDEPVDASPDGGGDGAADHAGDARDIRALRTVADYQFGAGAGAALFPPGDAFELHRSTGGRPRQVYTAGRADPPDAEGASDDASGASDAGGTADPGSAGRRLVSYGTDGRFTLAVAGGRRLLSALDPPAYRVVVGDESEPFVRDGKNAFAKFVGRVDPEIRPGDEVLVVHERGDLLAVGRAALSAEAMVDFHSGMAVAVREGVDG